MRGARPLGMVIVTESRDIARNARQRDLYPVLFNPDQTEDWRVLHGLNVGLCTYLDRAKVVRTCQEILAAEPRAFAVTYFGGAEIEHERIVDAAHS